MSRASLLLAVVAALVAPAPALAVGPTDIPARAYIVVDDRDGVVLAGRGAHRRGAVASITKLMTAYVTLRALPPDAVARVPVSATRIGESTVGLRAGQRVPVRQLLAALLVPSGNDAARTLAVRVAGSETRFVQRMNAAARALRLRNTAYRTPFGLDRPGQWSTAADSVRLARILMDDARFRRIVRQRAVRVGGTRYANRNRLLGAYPGLDGVKTGHTDDAGWSLVASATQNGARLYVAALGAPTERARDRAVRRLLDWGFSRYRPVALVGRGDPFGSLALPYDAGRVPVVTGRALQARLRVGTAVRERVTLPDALTPPLAAGATVGRVELLAGTRRLGVVPLVTARAAPAPTRSERALWFLRRARARVLDPASWF